MAIQEHPFFVAKPTILPAWTCESPHCLVGKQITCHEIYSKKAINDFSIFRNIFLSFEFLSELPDRFFLPR